LRTTRVSRVRPGPTAIIVLLVWVSRIINREWRSRADSARVLLTVPNLTPLMSLIVAPNRGVRRGCDPPELVGARPCCAARECP